MPLERNAIGSIALFSQCIVACIKSKLLQPHSRRLVNESDQRYIWKMIGKLAFLRDKTRS